MGQSERTVPSGTTDDRSVTVPAVELDRLRASERRYRLMVEHSPDVLVELSEHGTVRYASPAFYRLLGLPDGSWVGRRLTDLVHPGERGAVEGYVRAVMENPGPTHVPPVRVVVHGGGWRTVEGTVENLLADPAAGVLVATFRDVTQRLLAEERLQQQADLLDLAHDAIVVRRSSGEVMFWNRGAEALYGWTAEEAVGTVLHDLLGTTFPEQLESIETASGTGSWEGAVVQRTKDGREIVVESRWALRPGDPPLVLEIGRDVTGQQAAVRALETSEQRFRALVQQASDVVLILDAEGRVVHLSPSAEALFGYEPERLLGTVGAELVHPDDLASTLACFQRIAEPGASTRARYRVANRDGQWRHVETAFTNLLHEPSVGGFVLNSRDVTERAEAEARRMEYQRQLLAAQRLSMTGSWELELSTGATRWSEEMFRILGLDAGEAVPSLPALLEAVHPDDRGVLAEARFATGGAGTTDQEFRVVRPDGTVRTVLGRVETEFSDEGEALRLTGALQDITQRKHLETLLAQRSLYDELTGLANRDLFVDRVDHALRRQHRGAAGFAVLVVDLDDFKTVNVSLGHARADRVLVAVGRLLLRLVRPSDTVARLGGDEFALLLEGADLAVAEQGARRVHEALQRALRVGSHQLYPHASVGIAVSSEGVSAEDVLREANLALDAVKATGKGNRYEFFHPGLESAARRRMELQRELRRALERREFRLCYQPVVRLDSGRIIGVEALLRWKHPELGLVPPAEFVPVAEESGVIVAIGGWVLREAAHWMQRVNAARSGPGLNMSVNLSPRELGEPGLLRAVEDTLDQSGLDPKRLVIEITERVVVEDREVVLPVLDALRARGVRVAVDDFGTGYSSLSYLRNLPVDVVKIDRSFVSGVTDSPADAEVARAVVRLAQALGLATVAEGIETPGQVSALLSLGCTYGQGYFFSGPVSSAQIEELLAAQAAAEAGWSSPGG